MSNPVSLPSASAAATGYLTHNDATFGGEDSIERIREGMAHWEPTPSVDQRGERDGGAFSMGSASSCAQFTIMRYTQECALGGQSSIRR